MQTSRQRYEAYYEELLQRDPSEIRDHEDRPYERQRGFWELLGEYLGWLDKYRSSLIVSLTTLTIATGLRLVPLLSIKLAVDAVLQQQQLPPWWTSMAWLPTDPLLVLWVIGGAAVAIAFLSAAIHVWGRWEMTRINNRLMIDLRKAAFEQAVRLPLHRIQDLKTGAAVSVLREDTAGASGLTFTMVYNPWQAIIQLAGSIVVLAVVDWRLMIGALVLLPAIYLTHRTWVTWIRPIWRDIRRCREEVDSQATETFGGIRVVRTFGREKVEGLRYVTGNQVMVRQTLLAWWIARLLGFFWELIIPIAATGLMLYGGWGVLNEHLTPGDLTLFLAFLLMLLVPLSTLVNSATEFQSGLAGFDRILDLLAEPREMQATDQAVTVSPSQIEGAISFENVWFAYPDTTHDVLQGIDLEVQAGETIALVGRSGSGKTTFCNLAARFYDPTQGRITLDGRDLREIDARSYRRLLGIVEQDVFLFDGTVRENIGYGRRDATQAEIEAAAVAAHAHEFILGLPDAYDTFIGERGVKLSGGQRQRLAIARAILADPAILILDEATSNLDSESERYIQQSLEELVHGRTSFIIAHRLSTIIHADRIVVLEHGRIIEVGSHEQLMREGRRYRSMVELQMAID